MENCKDWKYVSHSNLLWYIFSLVKQYSHPVNSKVLHPLDFISYTFTYASFCNGTAVETGYPKLPLRRRSVATDWYILHHPRQCCNIPTVCYVYITTHPHIINHGVNTLGANVEIGKNCARLWEIIKWNKQFVSMCLFISEYLISRYGYEPTNNRGPVTR